MYYQGYTEKEQQEILKYDQEIKKSLKEKKTYRNIERVLNYIDDQKIDLPPSDSQIASLIVEYYMLNQKSINPFQMKSLALYIKMFYSKNYTPIKKEIENFLSLYK